MKRPPDIAGTFQFLLGSGKSKPVRSGYRPLHKLYENYLSSGEHQYVGVAEVHPGETALVEVWLISPEVYPGCLWPGREIEVLEGSRVVGSIRIERVLNSLLLGSAERHNPLWVEPKGASR